MLRQYLFLICLLQCICTVTNAQYEQWEELQNHVETLGIVIAPPLENQFKTIKNENDILSADFIIKKRKGDLEIRYIIRPAHNNLYPHIAASNILITLATNDPEKAISVLPIEEDILEKDYRADWGVQAFFKPKDSFSEKEHGKLVAIYKEGKAMAFMVFLFNDVEMDLEAYEFILTFDD